MVMIIREIDKTNLQHINQCDTSFIIDSKLLLHVENGKIYYAVVEVPPYTKQYASDEIDFSPYLSHPHKTIFIAYTDGEPAGQIRVVKYWNGYAYIDNFAVDTKYRRQGIGRALMERAIE